LCSAADQPPVGQSQHFDLFFDSDASLANVEPKDDRSSYLHLSSEGMESMGEVMPMALFQESYQSDLKSKDPLDFSAASVESVRPGDLSEFSPSLIEESVDVQVARRKPVSILRMKHRNAISPQAHLASVPPLSKITEDSGARMTNHLCVPSRRGVTFAPQVVAGVTEIPNRSTWTKEEKESMHSDGRTLKAEGDMRFVEREFECSRFCLDNVVEEDEFFRDHLGEMVHPAYFHAYVYDVIPLLASDPHPGIFTRAEFRKAMMHYSKFYDDAVLQKRFHPKEAENAMQVVASKRLRRRRRTSRS
jgi:hypothetical protein